MAGGKFVGIAHIDYDKIIVCFVHLAQLFWRKVGSGAHARVGVCLGEACSYDFFADFHDKFWKCFAITYASLDLHVGEAWILV